MARKKHKRIIYIASGPSPDGEGWVSIRIPKKDVEFYKIRGYRITKKIIEYRRGEK
jgi:hypothetical protein